MRERHLAGVGRRTAADEAGYRDGMVRRPEGPLRHQRATRRQQSSYRPDGRDLEPLAPRWRRQHASAPTRQHCLAGAGWADEQYVMAARGRDLERALGVSLAAHLAEIAIVPTNPRRRL